MEMSFLNVLTKRVKSFVLPTAKVATVVFTNSVFYENSSVRVRTGGTKCNPVEVGVTLDYKAYRRNSEVIPEECRLTSYDRIIYSAVVSLYEAGNKYFTPRMILNVLSGSSHKSITGNAGERIIDSLHRMRNISITVDANNEAEEFGVEDFQYSGSLLPCEEVDGVCLNNKIGRAHV